MESDKRDQNVNQPIQNALLDELVDLGIGKELSEKPPELQEEDLGIYEDDADGTDISDLDLKNTGQTEERLSGKESDEDTEKKSVIESNVHVTLLEKPQVKDLKEVESVAEVLRTEEPDDGSSMQRASAAMPRGMTVSIQPVGRSAGGLTSEMSFDSRNVSRLPSESRESVYRRAMMLLSARCASVSRTLEPCVDDELPYGAFVPEYFYIQQEKPTPMQPLKAWRGYGGNVYFEPINIKTLNFRSKSAFQPPMPMSRHSNKPQTVHLPTRPHVNTPSTDRPRTDSGAISKQSNKNTSDDKKEPVRRQLVILDKRAVLTRLNNNLKEDLVWIDGVESTGSLAVRPRSERVSGTTAYNKEKICKGSVVHKIFEAKRKQKPLKLRASGDKYIQPLAMSSLLRTQTQYSLNNQRLTTNSPEMYRSDKLPPLNLFRTSLRQVNRKENVHGPITYGRAMTVVHDLKPVSNIILI